VRITTGFIEVERANSLTTETVTLERKKWHPVLQISWSDDEHEYIDIEFDDGNVFHKHDKVYGLMRSVVGRIPQFIDMNIPLSKSATNSKEGREKSE